MAARVCPHCQAKLSAEETAAHSNDMECPNCGARLEVGPGGRTISSLCGLAAGAIVWRLTRYSTGDLSGVLPTLYSFLAFGIVSPIVLMMTANLQNAPVITVLEALHSSSHAGHGTDDHGASHH